MTGHMDDGLLQDFAEGLLEEGAEMEVREHVSVCPGCREALAEIQDLLGGLRGLPAEGQPARDLWPQIAWRIEGAKTGGEERLEAAEEPAAGEVGPAPDSGRDRRRRVDLAPWQLMAASIALMVISGGSVWAFLSVRPDPSPGPVPDLVSPAQPAGWQEAYGGYEEAVEDLEAVLERGREVLDPETVRVLEQNLLAIDQAIQEAEAALAQDPASTILRRFLTENLRKKVDLLRQAAGAVYTIT